MRHRLSGLAAIILTIMLVGCGQATEPAATPTTRPLPSPTDTPSPTETFAPTRTPPPTATPTSEPTQIPSASPTSRPTPTPASTPTPAVELTAIGAITAERIGEEVSVKGTVVEAASFSEGFKFTLDDGTGQIVLLMWHDVYDDCWDAGKINLGAEVQATGAVGQYEGTLQIEPGFGGDVKAIEGTTASAPLREISSLSSDDEGKRVMIEGNVLRVEGLPSAVKVFVGSDGTADQGEIVVFIWRNVLDRVKNNAGLGTEGSRVRVVGVVELYKSNLELVPTLPNDVTVLEVP